MTPPELKVVWFAAPVSKSPPLSTISPLSLWPCKIVWLWPLLMVVRSLDVGRWQTWVLVIICVDDAGATGDCVGAN
jgi:hypothetical protein